MNDLVYQPAWALAGMIWEGSYSSREVLEAHLEQIDRHNAGINAVVHLDREGALARAREADQALARGELWGPLHGVPMTVKDAYAVRGMPVSNGMPKQHHRISTDHAALVERLEAAGAIIMGKTNLPLGSFDWQCKHPTFGRTQNPYDPQLTPGGSSGGSAAALAAGFTPLELGSDAAGSLRVPAHFCGVTCLRPTEGWLSDRGVHEMPGYPRLTWQITSCGPMARNVSDLKMAMTVLAGPDRHRWQVPPISWPSHVEDWNLQGMRIAWDESPNGAPLGEDSKKVLNTFVDRLADEGCDVHRAAPRVDARSATRTWGRIEGHYMAAAMPAMAKMPLLRLPLTAGLLPYFFGKSQFASGMAGALRVGNRAFYEALSERSRLIACMEDFFDDYDLLLTPVAATTAFKHQRPGKSLTVNGKQVSYGDAMGLFNCPSALTANPIVVLPVGKTSAGLPVGIQIQARRWRDPLLLDIAEKMETLVDHNFQPLATSGYAELRAS